MKEARKNASEEEIVSISNAICVKISEYLLAHKGAELLFYYPLGKEISLNPLFEMASEYECYYPRVHGEEMDFYKVSSLSDLREGAFHIMEPVVDGGTLFEPLPDKQVICFVPGLAFSRDGGRCGYGKGYYDKYLSKYPNVIKIGICADFQLIDSLNTDEYDIKMDYIITEKEIIEL